MVFDLDDDFIYHIHREEDYYYPSPVVKKINLMDISIIPWEEKKFSVIIVAFVNFFFKLLVCFLDTTVYFFYTFIAHDLVGIEQV